MDKRFVKDLRRGDQVSAVYLVETANCKTNRSGKLFIQLMLRDRTASVKGLRWEATQEEFRNIERNPFLHVQGRVEEFQGALQIVVDEFDTLSPEDARVLPEDFLPHAARPSAEMMEELQTHIDAIENDDIKKVVNQVLDRPGVRQGLLMAPAGKVMHHAYIGGLLEHVVSLCSLSRRIAKHYPWLNGDLLVAGAILHDIGKVEELAYRTGFSYTDPGQLVGHICMGVSWIENAGAQLPDVDPDIILQLQHMVASHHGKLEYGAAKVPMTAEAMALHYLDNLDAKLAAFHQSLEETRNMGSDSRWSDFNPMLGARLYFPAPGSRQR